jgi:GMP synthase (glutamine-hydrolysing)
MHRAVDYLDRLHEHDVPTLGICFGHQLLGLMAGGRVDRNPGGRELGPVRMRVLGPSPLLDVEGEVVVNASHVDSVQDLPGHTSTLGRTRLEANALVQFGARSWGVQFHPEFDREITSCYVRERRAAILAEGLDPESLLLGAEDSPEARRVIPNFLRRVVLAQ